MFSNGFSRTLLLLASLPLSAESDGQATVFSVTPDTCVALNQGRTCYATIDVSWQGPASDDYCLMLDGQSQPLHCWQQVSEGRWRFEFAAEQSTKLLLLRQQQPVAQHEIQVNWVYESQRRKRSWRLF